MNGIFMVIKIQILNIVQMKIVMELEEWKEGGKFVYGNKDVAKVHLNFSFGEVIIFMKIKK